MSYQMIKDAALDLFATHGYEGTSLAMLADQVGIKKQSIYAHFKGKDDIFLQVLKETFDRELELDQAYLTEHFHQPLARYLWHALEDFIYRFHHEYRLKFWLRTTFFPPSHLYEEVVRYQLDYIDQVDTYYLRRFIHAYDQQEITQDPKIATLAFSSLLDSISVELVYGGEARTNRKLHAAWQVFWLGITNQTQQP
ncbi:TetR/AcrR family transcriptional regulator [Paraliobacillus ryukyuensis]|uniref:TetR/AcrR family transcriptional regulator n=1 Tax=Paraliobacillus ryukyuensis TaxID=200904 RepID=UPI0009A90F54|nr:TetR/AcrR family transcriptional regulator [Paraliobacillus ryukyuensis]